MATLSTPFSTETDDQQKQTSGQPTSINTGSVAGTGQTAPNASAPGSTSTSTGTGGSVAAGPGTAASAPAQGGAAPTTSGSYTNLSRYINANKDFNSQNGGLAGQITNNIQKQGAAANQNIQGASQAFQQQAQSNLAPAQQAGQSAMTALADPYGTATGTSLASYATNPDNVANFSTAANAAYTGPQNLSNLQGSQNLNNLQAQANNVSQEASQTASEGGRYNLLSSMFGKNNYTPGQQNLDNLFLQSSPNQIKQLQGTQQIANQTQSNLTNAQQNAQNTAQANAAAAAGIASNVQQGLQKAQGQVVGDVQNNLKNNQNVVSQLGGDIANNNLSADDLAKMGWAGGAAYGLTPAQIQSYINTGTPTASNSANAQQVAALNALSTLAGTNSANLGALPVTGLDLSQAGTFNPFNSSAFNTAVGNQQQLANNAMSNDYNAYQKWANSTQGGYAPDATAGYIANNTAPAYANLSAFTNAMSAPSAAPLEALMNYIKNIPSQYLTDTGPININTLLGLKSALTSDATTFGGLNYGNVSSDAASSFIPTFATTGTSNPVPEDSQQSGGLPNLTPGKLPGTIYG